MHFFLTFAFLVVSSSRITLVTMVLPLFCTQVKSNEVTYPVVDYLLRRRLLRDEGPEHAQGGVLEVDVVGAEDLLNLRVDERGLARVAFLLLPLRYLLDADIDHICRRHADVHSLVFESVEHAPVVVLHPEEFVERDHGLLLAEFLQDEHGRVLLDVVGLGVGVLLQPEDRLVQGGVDDFCSDLASCLGQIAQTLGSFLHELFVVSAQLVEEDRNELVDVVDDLGLAGDVQNLVQGDEDAELLVFPRALELEPELLEDVVGLFGVLLEVLKQLYGGLLLDLDVLVFKIEPNAC